MCRAYMIDFIQPPCTSHCTSHLTARVRPCKQRGTSRCVHSTRKLELLYCCAFHFQMAVYPQVMQLTQDVLSHRTEAYGNKFDALHPSVQPHLRQFGYCSLYGRSPTPMPMTRPVANMLTVEA